MDSTFDLSTGTLTLKSTLTPGPRGPVGPAGSGSNQPGGRLSLASAMPEMSQISDYSSNTLFYAPFESDQLPIFDGANWGCVSFTSDPLDQVGLSMAGGAKWASNSKYDVFATLVGNSLALCTGPAWSADAVIARGLIRRNGIWVNAADVICDISDSNSVTVAANQATWLGSINIGPTAGVLLATFALGQNRRCDVWNLYHQKDIALGVGCPIASSAAPVVWNPTQSYQVGYQAFNNDLKNSGYYFTGLPQIVECDYRQWTFLNSYVQGPCAAFITICKDTLSAPTTNDAVSSDAVSPNYVENTYILQTEFIDRGALGSHRAIMGCAGANNFGNAAIGFSTTMIGLDPRTAWGSLDRAHVMWIKYKG